MADDQVLNQSLQFFREAGLKLELRLQHFELDNHMAKELAFRRVTEGAVVGELVNLADVVEEGSSQEKVAIDLRIVLAHQIAGTEERDDVIEQASDVSVVKSFGRGSVPVSGGDFRIGHEGLDQRL